MASGFISWETKVPNASTTVGALMSISRLFSQQHQGLFKKLDNPVEKLEGADTVGDPVIRGQHQAHLVPELGLAGRIGPEHRLDGPDTENHGLARIDDGAHV